MYKNKIRVITLVLIAVTGVFITACQHWDNFTTYFNTYYNMERLMGECENEFEFVEEKKRVTPRILVPEPVIYVPAVSKIGPPDFMKDLIIRQQQRQPVDIKLDSILIKGSKVIAKHPKSDYIQGTLFLMAKTYFYKNEWLPSQIKCSELIDKFPDGDFSPDAHLLMAKNYLIQRKFVVGKTILSRTVDIAWQKKRYDILSDAFRLEAELALFLNEKEDALRPYRQAIAQTDDQLMKAKWQVELASLMFRMSMFERAERAFRKVHNYSPDYLAEYEAYLYQASCLDRLGRFNEAAELLEELEDDGKWEEWMGNTFAERINSVRMKLILKDSLKLADVKRQDLDNAEKFADSAYIGNGAITSAYFEIGMDYFGEKDYLNSRTYFARAKSVKSPIYRTAEKLYHLLNLWDSKKNFVIPNLMKYYNGKSISDSSASLLAMNCFEFGRAHEQLGNPDSALVFYKIAAEVTPRREDESARYLYSWARMVRDSNYYQADSILDVVVNDYPFTDFGKDAASRLGYTNEFVVDTVRELYFSGDRLRKFGDHKFALTQFKKLFNTYPESEYAPKALYSTGWIWEREYFPADTTIVTADSALYYYQMLIERYPASEYAEDVRIAVNYLLALRSGEPIPDSLKVKQVVRQKPVKKKFDISDQQKINDIKNNKVKKSPSILDQPKGLLNGMKNLISNPSEAVEKSDLENSLKLPDMPENPLNIFKSDDEEKKKSDDKSKEKKENEQTVPDSTKKK